nr:hypothetical protein [Tanacetum cinerariifolium]
FRAVSFKVSLSFALIAIIAILIIVFVAVVVVGVVVIVAVVVGGGVVVVGIYRSASTVPGQMGNPFAIIAPRWARTFMMCSASYYDVAGSDCFQKYPQTSVCS